MSQTPDRISIAILGASGYTGIELLRLLAMHPNAGIRTLTADRHAGKELVEIFPHVRPLRLPKLVKIDEVDWSGHDLVFCCLPHATTQEVISQLPGHLKVVDLSADFRLSDIDVYARWYGHEHRAPELQKEAVYGLTELARDEVRRARLVANPGCYPTTVQLPLIPLLQAGAVATDGIVVDAKSGVTGAGRSMREDLLFAEVHDGIHAYGVGKHRHTPEIEQGLARAAGREVRISFTPHLMPMNRGILATTYVELTRGATAQDLREQLAKRYAEEPFVHVLPFGQVPATRHVRGTNHCFIGVATDNPPGRAIIISATDNLVKGASGQAIQNMNAMLGLPETTGLGLIATFP